ncbi:MULTISPECIES: phosphoribosylanthranilate isomerase [Thermoactinomyces]|jgi:phosphoribosylanthranilate isomerase|uniref:phosphoribosylanthranilate isomerase n=1 Tax=Thermoactinomyces TaxID=2023 RepID=UPI0018DD3CB6|nr:MULTISPECIES: phosphoribosylanthranilate isomerase [Thermoactinomyces]MBH8582316.1 phosphoribosylanthranilate isomerase [Thermoactinomyces sp. CICC 10735]MBH8584888.1 phosphoribosylanthranilate isomerase [Thermoactinomyces sp. CICC 10520]MBI0391080.1 phosphoribosylanthranilate isomerase [Thermoactinomyces sp. CICC 24226]MCF6134342.1 phosphoribosylanthranilate isomerase [Thermoactinomyces vulgaris]
MKKPFIKFCGFQSVRDVQKVSRLPVDAVGFILVPGRRRSVTRSRLPELIRHLSAGQAAIGVLQNPSWDEVKSWLETASLSGIQLHGEEPAGLLRKIKSARPGLHLTKVIHMQDAWPEPARLKAYQPWADAILLDTAAGNIKGGTGKPFDWRLVPAWKEACNKLNLPCWVAGGLDENNVVELITRYRPDGIDVSGGIEINQRKDGVKMRLFLERVKRAYAATS